MEARRLKIALAVSLVINVFVIGAAVGYLLGPSPFPGGPPPRSPAFSAAEKLTPADRDAFQQALLDANQASGPVALDARLARRELNRLMKTQPFDRAAADAAMARARADDQQVRAGLDKAVLDFAATLSPLERAALADGFRRAAAQRRELHGPDGPPPNRPPGTGGPG